jgi:hypothetical protein
MTVVVNYVEDEDLLIEAAHYAVSINCGRNRFITLAKRAWREAAVEAGIVEPYNSAKLTAALTEAGAMTGVGEWRDKGPQP